MWGVADQANLPICDARHPWSSPGLIQQGYSEMGRIASVFLTCGVAIGLVGAVSSAAATTTTTQVHHRKSTRHSTHRVTHHAAVTSTRLVRGRDGKLHRVAVRRRYYYEHF